MLVLQLLPANTTWAFPMLMGATLLTPSNSLIALASFTVKVLELPLPDLAPPAVDEPESTIKRLLPIALMESFTDS